LIRVISRSRADRWTGRRSEVECLGLGAVREQGDRYWLNAHPEGPFLRPSGTSEPTP
jgi:hypothetical protein